MAISVRNTPFVLDPMLPFKNKNAQELLIFLLVGELWQAWNYDLVYELWKIWIFGKMVLIGGNIVGMGRGGGRGDLT